MSHDPSFLTNCWIILSPPWCTILANSPCERHVNGESKHSELNTHTCTYILIDLTSSMQHRVFRSGAKSKYCYCTLERTEIYYVCVSYMYGAVTCMVQLHVRVLKLE